MGEAAGELVIVSRAKMWGFADPDQRPGWPGHSSVES